MYMIPKSPVSVMRHAVTSGIRFRFGLFEADAANGVLSRGGTQIKIQEQPFCLLILLLERPGEVISREELRQRLWPEGTYVDFNGSLNVILKRLRTAVGDDPENPRFIETVPRRGYRFIAPVSVIEESSPNGLPQTSVKASLGIIEAVQPSTPASNAAAFFVGRNQRQRRYLMYAECVIVAIIIAVSAWFIWPSGWFGRRQFFSRNTPVQLRKSVAVLGFQNLSGRAEDAWLATALSEMLSTELAGGEKLRLISGEDVANLRVSAPWPLADTLDRGTTARIGTTLSSDALVLGSYLAIGTTNRGQLRLDVRMQDGKTGEILIEISEVGSTQDLFHLVSRVGAKLRDRLGIQELQGADEASVLAALPLDPEVARFYALGVAKLREFDALAAKDLLEQAADADPKFPMVHAMLARAWAILGYEQKHQEEAKKAFDLSTDLPRAQRLLVEGEYYESLGKQEQAASVYHALFELFPDNVDYGLRLAAAQTLSGHGSQAMEIIHRLRSLPPLASEDPRIDLAEARAMKDDKLAVLTLVRSAMRKASERGQKLVYAMARKEECSVLNYGEHPDQAMPACEEAYNVFLGAGNRLAAADAVRMVGDAQGTLGHKQLAIETYQRALRLLEGLGEHEKTGVILNNMAIGFENQGKLDRAEELYKQAKFHFEQAGNKFTAAVAMGNIADILYERGKLGAAAKAYQQTLDLMATIDHGSPGYALYRFAGLQLAQGNVKEAQRMAQQAIDSMRPSQGRYQYLTSAVVELGEALEAQGDLAGARSQFEQTLAIRQKMGALDLAAESQIELARLDIEEKRPEQAEPLIRSAIAECEEEKSDPDLSSAYTLLSRVLLIEGKVEEASKAAQRGAELSLTSSDPALRLPAEIQQARVEMANAGDDKAKLSVPLRQLHAVIAVAGKLGYYNFESEARLALGDLELKTNSSLGRKHLTALASETRDRGLELLARQAEGAITTGTVVAENRLAH